jgi:hypothetical protein
MKFLQAKWRKTRYYPLHADAIVTIKALWSLCSVIRSAVEVDNLLPLRFDDYFARIWRIKILLIFVHFQGDERRYIL